eukprot:gene5761-9582_t
MEKLIDAYDSLVNDSYGSQLKYILEQREKEYSLVTKYQELKSTLTLIKENKLKEMKTQVDLGSNFYMKAKMYF